MYYPLLKSEVVMTKKTFLLWLQARVQVLQRRPRLSFRACLHCPVPCHVAVYVLRQRQYIQQFRRQFRVQLIRVQLTATVCLLVDLLLHW